MPNSMLDFQLPRTIVNGKSGMTRGQPSYTDPDSKNAIRSMELPHVAIGQDAAPSDRKVFGLAHSTSLRGVRSARDLALRTMPGNIGTDSRTVLRYLLATERPDRHLH